MKGFVVIADGPDGQTYVLAENGTWPRLDHVERPALSPSWAGAREMRRVLSGTLFSTTPPCDRFGCLPRILLAKTVGL